ncbi:hypothetical protein A4A49_61917, partial [Nicotiana attenuata]
MSEISCSSKRKCHCGKIAHLFTSKTSFNPGRRFYKCPKPEANSCGYWEWHDKVFHDRASVVISNLKAQLDATSIKINTLSTSLEVVKIERDKLKEKVKTMEAINNSQVNKARELEEKFMKLKMFIMSFCAMFV